MSDASEMLARFHGHTNVVGTATNSRRLRYELHREEHRELEAELEYCRGAVYDREQIARELADVVYVAYGTAHVFGIDLDVAIAEVHRAAMQKVEANMKRDDGKIVKPPGFVPPSMGAAIRGRDQFEKMDA